MESARILIVEDEAVIALDLMQRLLQLGYQVLAIAESAEMALEAIAQEQPDLVLMDIRLRGLMNGVETAAHLRQNFNLPVVFVTAHVDETTLTQAKKTQPYGYIVKPFESHTLSTAIEIALSRHQAEIAIQTALEREKELHQLKSRFVAVLSHEFRNPLSAVMFSLDQLSRHSKELTIEKQQLSIQRAKDAIKRIEQLLEDILILEEMELDQFQCRPLPIDLLYFSQELVNEFQSVAGTAYRLQLIADPQEFNHHYSFDIKLLRHILNNLLSNAIKYSPNGGDIHLELTCASSMVTFRIQDWGIGISSADQERLFAAFSRGTNVSHIPGTGLGLFIVKQCVEAQGGQITVESDEGKGTTFTVRLPIENEVYLNNISMHGYTASG